MIGAAKRTAVNDSWVWRMLLIFALLYFPAGCESNLQTGYGRPTGARHATSVNGTRVLHELFQSKGFDTDRYGKFSPRWDRYQTVIWIPDTYEAPSDELITSIEFWLSSSRRRRLVFVARDYNAAMTYWESLIQNSSQDTEQKDDLRRQYHDETTNYLYGVQQTDRLGCAWYELEHHPYSQAESVAGPMAENLFSEKVDIRYHALPTPGKVAVAGRFGDYDVDVKLTVDGHPFVYVLGKQELGTSEIVVVGNASFLLNVPLIHRGNQELAEELIDSVTANMYNGESVLFIESEDDLPIAERDSPDVPSQWGWIAQKPLRFIVPYLLFCSLLFCFVYFPIFGRPLKTKPPAHANFRDHIDALGQLIKRTNSTEMTDVWIEEYKRRQSRKSNIEN